MPKNSDNVYDTKIAKNEINIIVKFLPVSSYARMMIKEAAIVGNIVNSIPEWVRKDIAIEVISEVLADKRREIEREEQKAEPDSQKLKQMEEEKRNLLRERQEMYLGRSHIQDSYSVW